MSMKPSKVTCLVVLLSATLAASCDSCGSTRSGSSSGGLSSGGGWLVGRSALMINVPHDATRDIGHTSWMSPTTCWGLPAAARPTPGWSANRGLMMSTRDAGATWRVLDPGVTSTLRAVALAAPDTVYVAGDGEVARASFDGGRSWQPLAGAPALTWTSVTARKSDGGLALLASATGQIYRYETSGGGLVSAGQSAHGAVFSVVLGRNGITAVAVGEAGAILVSADSGRTWRERASGVTTTLRDVWLTGDEADRFVAVGDGGLLLEGAVFGAGTESRNLGPGVNLRALHLEASGDGTIVGDSGTVFQTDDFGVSWNRLEIDDHDTSSASTRSTPPVTCSDGVAGGTDYFG